MLFINGDESEAREGNVVFDESVGADDELGFAICNALEGSCFFGMLHAADEEFDLVA